MVHHTVQMVQMNPPLLAVHQPVPVIQTFVFKLGTSFYLDKTAETVQVVGAATVDSV